MPETGRPKINSFSHFGNIYDPHVYIAINRTVLLKDKANILSISNTRGAIGKHSDVPFNVIFEWREGDILYFRFIEYRFFCFCNHTNCKSINHSR